MIDGGRSKPTLIERLEREPERFELFQAVRLLESDEMLRARAAGDAAPPVIGGRDHGTVSKSAIRFHSTATLGFPHGAVTAVRRATDPDDPSASRVHVELACFGLIGPGGPLPRHYTALVAERARRHRDTTLRDFLDVFVQRMAAQLYGAWAKYRHAAQYERASLAERSAPWDDAATEPRDGITALVAALVGLGGRGLPGRVAGGDERVLRYAAHYARQPRCTESLERLLTDAFGVAARIEPFVGRWLDLEPADQTALASRASPEGVNARLGAGAVAGRRVWDVASTFEVVIGPVSGDAFFDRLPGTPTLAAIGDLVRLYVGPEYEARVRLVLAAAEVPACRLGGSSDGRCAGGGRLGWTTWLSADGGTVDRDDAVFTIR